MEILEVQPNDVIIRIHETECERLAHACRCAMSSNETCFGDWAELFAMAALAASGAEIKGLWERHRHKLTAPDMLSQVQQVERPSR